MRIYIPIWPLDGVILKQQLIASDNCLSIDEKEKELARIRKVLVRRDIAIVMLVIGGLLATMAMKVSGY